MAANGALKKASRRVAAAGHFPAVRGQQKIYGGVQYPEQFGKF